ncbi:nicotinic acid mononucleotide adenyltransferase [Nonlabens tegetincola]|uniref:nicotinic acid mononucleotide adenyltransferase n=1 Tax=Nonlabens tegetincola TaxID=323273 RepID=UPI000CF50E6F|nr:nicotinic acid mononucleotide adenyltransferase [Nonlabens tegetincola]PQJ20281.1 nicotinic acid mononucleotide adenyltransferase [Nonlabens tegetincola]
MRTITTFLGAMLLFVLTTSCDADIQLGDGVVAPTLEQVVEGKQLWYVDLNYVYDDIDIPFITQAFTLSFDYGTLMANNNLVGVGSAGAGMGISVGYYETFENTLIIHHDIDGTYEFDVRVKDFDRIHLIDPASGSLIRLQGYQIGNFDYDALFYDNIHYFLQEYRAWEKTFTSNAGVINEFDRENFLSFFPSYDGDTFLSSKDARGTSIQNLLWDYEGSYLVENQNNDLINKYLTLHYENIGNEMFDLYVINDRTIELYHISSGTTYRFTGKGYIQIKNSSGKSRLLDVKKKKSL